MAKAVRLDKFLADAGKGTRSEVKKFIQKGQVQVNGAPAKKPELKLIRRRIPLYFQVKQSVWHRNLFIIF